MDFEKFLPYLQKPAPFTPGEPLFWDDPHISAGMLDAHLNPNNDVASRRPETVKATADWLVRQLNFQPGASILDLGCGPGLYAAELALRGLKVTGVDYSKRSIAYAEKFAAENGLEIEYRYQNYLDLADDNGFDAALLIYGDYCPLSPEQRSRLLANIHRALKPGGFFVLDVSTRRHREKYGNRHDWYAVESGFWKPGPHLVLEEGFDYPDESIYLDQYIVIEEGGKTTVYRNWFQDYTLETITREFAEGNFTIRSAWNDLTGTALTEDTEWIGLVAQAAQRDV